MRDCGLEGISECGPEHEINKFRIHNRNFKLAPAARRRTEQPTTCRHIDQVLNFKLKFHQSREFVEDHHLRS